MCRLDRKRTTETRDLMKTITLETTNLCSYIDEQKPEYVFFTGGIAGVSDSSPSESRPESLNRSADVVELDRN